MKSVSPRNSIQLIGHLGADPEIKTFPAQFPKNGKSGESNTEGKLARLRLATNERYRNAKGEWADRTEWHTVVCWDAQAESAERQLQKGSEVLITGRLHYDTYTAKDGSSRTSAEIEAASLMLLDNGKEREGAANGKAAAKA